MARDLRIASMVSRLAIASLLLAAVPAAAPAEDWKRSYPVTGKPALRIDTDDGAVVVRAGNTGSIEAHIVTTGWRIGGDGVRITDHHTGDRVDIEVRTPKQIFSIGPRSVRIELTVPREAVADIRTGDGSVTVENLKGEARLRTGDGGVHVDAFDGSLTARTGDGRIVFRGRFDNLSVETGDGSIEGEIAPGSRLASPWRVETGDGSVKLRLPHDLPADLDVRTGDGGIHSDLNLTVSGAARGSSLRGKLAGGGTTFTIRTRDGSINLKSF